MMKINVPVAADAATGQTTIDVSERTRKLLGPVMELIKPHESGGDYSSIVTTSRGSHFSKKDPTKMTLGELKKAQDDGLVKRAGAFQFTPVFVDELLRLGVDPKTRLTRSNQDSLTMFYTEKFRPDGSSVVDLMGKGDTAGASLLLSRIFAVLPRNTGGASYYSGQGSNPSVAPIKWGDVSKALDAGQGNVAPEPGGGREWQGPVYPGMPDASFSDPRVSRLMQKTRGNPRSLMPPMAPHPAPEDGAIDIQGPVQNKTDRPGVRASAAVASSPVPSVPLGDEDKETRLSRLMAKSRATDSTSMFGSQSALSLFMDPTGEPSENESLFKRGFKDIMSGLTSVAPSSMMVLGGAMDYAGIHDYGEMVAKKGVDLQNFLNNHLAAEDPNLFDAVMSALGSSVAILVPGGAAAAWAARGAEIIGLASKAAAIFEMATGSGTAAFIESTMEQSQRQRELMDEGMGAGEALEASKEVFQYNMMLLMVTDLPFFAPGRRVARAALSSFSEGGQERLQSVIQDIAAGRGTIMDFFDTSKYNTETAAGSIVGFGAGMVMPTDVGSKRKRNERPRALPFEGRTAFAEKNDEPIVLGDDPAPASGDEKRELTPKQRAYWEEKGARKAAARAKSAKKAAVRQEERDKRDRVVPEKVERRARAIYELEKALSADMGVDVRLSTLLSEDQVNHLADQGAEAMRLDGIDPEKSSQLVVDTFSQAEKWLNPQKDEASPVGATRTTILQSPLTNRTEDSWHNGPPRRTPAPAMAPDSSTGAAPAVPQEEPAPAHTSALPAAEAVEPSSEAPTTEEDKVGNAVEERMREQEKNREDKEQMARDAEEFAKKERVWREDDDSDARVNEKKMIAAMELLDAYGDKYGETPPQIAIDSEEAAPPPSTEEKPAPREAKPLPADSGYGILPLAAIEQEPETFQPREDTGPDGYNEDVVADHVKHFDRDAVQPIEVWRDPKTGKFLVIDGHHTREILARTGYKEAVVKFFQGTREEAIAASESRNDQRRANDFISQAKIVRKQREGGATKKAIGEKARANYGRNANKIIAFSHLNPNGPVMSALRSFLKADSTSDSVANLTRIAKWIGEARARFPELTDSHEREMFEGLQKNFGKKWAKSESSFKAAVSRLTEVLGFDSTKPLGFDLLNENRQAQVTHDAELSAALKEMQAAQKHRDSLELRLEKNKTPVELRPKIMKSANDAVLVANAEYARVVDERGHADAAARAESESSLFRSRTKTAAGTLGSINRSVRRMFSKASLTSPRDASFTMISSIAKRLGVKNVRFVDGWMDDNGNALSGMYDEATDTIFLNVRAPEPLLTVMMHEVAHRMQLKHPDLWVQLASVVSDNTTTGGYAQYRAGLLSEGLYPESDVMPELVADSVMESAKSETFWRALHEQNPSLFGDLVSMVRRVLASIKAAFEDGGWSIAPYLKGMEEIERAAAGALGEMSAREQASAGVAREEQDRLTGQQSLFRKRSSKAATPEMQELVDEQDRQETRSHDARRAVRGGMLRWFYKKMWDQHTYTYVAVRDLLKKAGKTDYAWAKNPYIALRMFSGWSERAELAFREGVYSWNGKVKLFKGLESIIKDNGLAKFIESGEFSQFLRASRLRSMYESIGPAFLGEETDTEPGLLDEAPGADTEARQEYDKYMEVLDQYELLHPEWTKAVEELTRWSNATMKRLVQSGFMSQQQYDYLVEKYDVYAPMYVLDQEANTASYVGRPKAPAGKPYYNMKAFISGLGRMDPMDGMIKNNYRREYLAHMNEAKLKAADFIRDLSGGRDNLDGFGRRVTPDVDPVNVRVVELLKAAGLSKSEIDELSDAEKVDVTATASVWVASTYMDNNVMALSRDGVIEYWELDSDIFESFASGQTQGTSDLMKFFTAQTSMLRAGAVLTPEFIVRNPSRDIGSIAINAAKMVNGPKDALLLPHRILKGISSAIHHDQDYVDFLNDRGGHANLVSVDQENMPKKLEALLRQGDRGYALESFKKNPAKYLLHSHPLSALQYLSSLTENASRIAVHKKSKAEYIAAGYSEEEAGVRAGMEAREGSTDFNRSGDYGAILNKMIPFFNAGLQGPDKLNRTLFRDKGGRRAAWTKGALMITAPSILLWALNHDEDWYKKEPFWRKNMFWLISVDGGKSIIMIPKPFEAGLIFGSLVERFLDWSVDKDSRAMGAWTRTTLNNIVPMDPSSLLGPMAGAFEETRTNFDHYRNREIIKGYMKNLEPRQQYTESTTEFAKLVADLAPGGRLSPIYVDHFIKGAFGGLGKEATEIASAVITAADPARGKRRPAARRVFGILPEWLPVIRGVSTTGPSRYTQDMSDFYKEYDKAKEAVATVHAYKNGGASRAQLVEMYRSHGKDIVSMAPLSRLADQIGPISKRIHLISRVSADVLGPREKQKKIDELMKYRNDLLFRFMTKYRAVDWDKIMKREKKP